MKHAVISCFLFASLLLAGCATGPQYRDYAKTVQPPKEGEGRLWFYRRSVYNGMFNQPMVKVNGVDVAKAQPGCYFFIDRPAGDYEIATSKDADDQARVHVNPGSNTYVKLTLSLHMTWHLKPSPVSDEIGSKEIQDCELLSADGANRDVIEASRKKDSDTKSAAK
jgi:hypothetical protein